MDKSKNSGFLPPGGSSGDAWHQSTEPISGSGPSKGLRGTQSNWSHLPHNEDPFSMLETDSYNQKSTLATLAARLEEKAKREGLPTAGLGLAIYGVPFASRNSGQPQKSPNPNEPAETPKTAGWGSSNEIQPQESANTGGWGGSGDTQSRKIASSKGSGSRPGHPSRKNKSPKVGGGNSPHETKSPGAWSGSRTQKTTNTGAGVASGIDRSHKFGDNGAMGASGGKNPWKIANTGSKGLSGENQLPKSTFTGNKGISGQNLLPKSTYTGSKGLSAENLLPKSTYTGSKGLFGEIRLPKSTYTGSKAISGDVQLPKSTYTGSNRMAGNNQPLKLENTQGSAASGGKKPLEFEAAEGWSDNHENAITKLWKAWGDSRSHKYGNNGGWSASDDNNAEKFIGKAPTPVSNDDQPRKPLHEQLWSASDNITARDFAGRISGPPSRANIRNEPSQSKIIRSGDNTTSGPYSPMGHGGDAGIFKGNNFSKPISLSSQSTSIAPEFRLKTLQTLLNESPKQSSSFKQAAPITPEFTMDSFVADAKMADNLRQKEREVHDNIFSRLAVLEHAFTEIAKHTNAKIPSLESFKASMAQVANMQKAPGNKEVASASMSLVSGHGQLPKNFEAEFKELFRLLEKDEEEKGEGEKGEGVKDDGEKGEGAPRKYSTAMPPYIASLPPYVAPTHSQTPLALADMPTRFSLKTLLTLLGGREHYPGVYIGSKELSNYLSNTDQDKKVSKWQRTPSTKACYYALDTAINPFIPHKPGSHGAALAVVYREVSEADNPGEDSDHVFKDMPLFAAIGPTPGSDADSLDVYVYMGNYTQDRWSDKLSYSEVQEKVQPSIKDYWSRVLTAPNRPAWVDAELIRALFPTPAYAGPVPRQGDSVEGIKYDLDQYMEQLRVHKAEIDEHFANWDQNEAYKAFERTDVETPPALRFSWEYLRCTSFDRNFYYALCTAAEARSSTIGPGKHERGRPPTRGI